MVQNHIKTKNFKTHEACDISGLTSLIKAAELRLYSANSFYTAFLNFIEYCLSWPSYFLNLFPNTLKIFFELRGRLFLIGFLFELVWIFINWIICQVHESIFDVLFMRSLILFGAKSCQPFFVNVNPQRINRSNKNINSKIKFISID